MYSKYYIQKYSTTKNKIPVKEIFQITFAIQFSIFVVKHTSTHAVPISVEVKYLNWQYCTVLNNLWGLGTE